MQDVREWCYKPTVTVVAQQSIPLCLSGTSHWEEHMGLLVSREKGGKSALRKRMVSEERISRKAVAALLCGVSQLQKQQKEDGSGADLTSGH